jgi:hypothetical protein
MLFGHSKPTQTNEVRQSQRSAIGKVETVPSSQRKFYAKIDLKSSYYSVKVSKKLSQLFGFCHRDHFYAFTVLPMGWFLSSVLFQDIVSYVIDSCSDRLVNVKVVHQIDDILIVGTVLEDVQHAMNILVETFVKFGFIVRKDKCEGPSDNCTFCGLKLLGDGTIKPWPIKRQLNQVAADTAVELFEKAKTLEECKHTLRSWLGTANYFSKWMPSELREESLALHSLLSQIDSGVITKKEIYEKSTSFVRNLCTWWLENSYGLFGGPSDDENTLIVVDANVTGWSGCIFRLVRSTNDVPQSLPFSLSGLLSSHETELVPPGASIENYTLVPVRFDGARWGSIFETAQSSTWRERSAAMLIVHKNKEVLAGKVFVLSDNKNLCESWRDTEALTSRLCSAFLTYIGHVYGAIHVKRNHPVIQWVDNSARNIGVLALPVKHVMLDDGDPNKKPKVSNSDSLDHLDGDVEMESESESESEVDGNDELDSMDIETLESETESANLSTFLSREWIVKEGDRYFTTVKYPGQVPEHSLIIPSSESFDAIKTIHHTYGHPTLNGLRKILQLWKLWCLNFKEAAQEVLTECKPCLRCRDTYHPERSTIPMPGGPMQFVMADFLQPERNTQPALLVFRDRYSGFTEGRAIEKLDSFEVKQLLTEWIARYGPPKTFMSGNAEAFCSENMRMLYQKYNITHRKSPVYEPKSNGSVERVIKAIEEGLRMELNSGLPMQEAIHVVCGRLNRTSSVPGDSSMSSPRSVIFNFGELGPFDFIPKKPVEYKHDLVEGQTVLVKIPNASKLGIQYEDRNFTVDKIVGNHVYQLKDDSGNVLRSLYRRERLKPIFINIFEDKLPSAEGLS